MERFRKMSENLQRLCDKDEQQAIQRAKEIELLALKLDIEQAQEINRGRHLNIIRK